MSLIGKPSRRNFLEGLGVAAGSLLVPWTAFGADKFDIVYSMTESPVIATRLCEAIQSLGGIYRDTSVVWKPGYDTFIVRRVVDGGGEEISQFRRDRDSQLLMNILDNEGIYPDSCLQARSLADAVVVYDPARDIDRMEDLAGRTVRRVTNQTFRANRDLRKPYVRSAAFFDREYESVEDVIEQASKMRVNVEAEFGYDYGDPSFTEHVEEFILAYTGYKRDGDSWVNVEGRAIDFQRITNAWLKDKYPNAGDMRAGFPRMLKDMGYFLPMWEEIVVEKGFEPWAVWTRMAGASMTESRVRRDTGESSAGAEGWFQFMEKTARRREFNMQITPGHVDDRYAVRASSLAAAKYFWIIREDYGLGDVFGINGYNCGEGRARNDVERALSVKYSDYMGPSPRETENYAPSVIAHAYITAHPEDFGFDPLEINDFRENWETVRFRGQTTFDVLAKRYQGYQPDLLSKEDTKEAIVLMNQHVAAVTGNDINGDFRYHGKQGVVLWVPKRA